MRFLYRPNAGEPFREVVFKGLSGGGGSSSTVIGTFDVIKGTNTITLDRVYTNITVIDITHGLPLNEGDNFVVENNIVTVPKYNYTVKYKILG